MAEVAHTIPSTITFLDDSTFGVVRPGLQVTQFETGPFVSRDWFGHSVREYDLRISAQSSDNQRAWRTFLHNIDGGSQVVWLVEPVSRLHRGLICGPIADGTRTTFWIPAYSPTSVTIFVDGNPQASGYDIRTASNLCTDATASCTDAANFTGANQNDSASTGVVLDGSASIKVTPTGAGNSTAFPSAYTDVTVGRDYTAVVAVLETKSSARDFRADLLWYDSVPSALTPSYGTLSSAVVGEWTVFTVTDTAPASAAYVRPRAHCNSSDTTVWYYDCFAICPGDYDRWHLPSQCPGLVEFSAAPAAGSRITATATGKRIARCRIDPRRLSWRALASGYAYPSNISAVEAPEF